MSNDEPKLIGTGELGVEKKLSDFSDLLKNIETLDDKRRALWREIYENAISDRQNSYLLFAQLFQIANAKSTEWAVHGRTITGFVERMSKANDQLIRLAELIDKAMSKSNALDTDDMFERIQATKR